MNLPDLFYPKIKVIKELLKINEKAQKHGLLLTYKQSMEIVEERKNILESYGRVELSVEVTKKLMDKLIVSPYINQENYQSTIIDLHEIFYYIKNETKDEIGDDELIEILIDLFNNNCAGCVELLEGREADKLINKYSIYKNRIYKGGDHE